MPNLRVGTVCIYGITGKQVKLKHRVELQYYFENLIGVNVRVFLMLYIFIVILSRLISFKMNTRIQKHQHSGYTYTTAQTVYTTTKLTTSMY